MLTYVQMWDAPIWATAHRHGITDDAIRHALRNFFARADDPEDDDVTLLLGADAAGSLIEIGILATDEGPVVIHAMRGRLHRFFPTEE